MFNKEVIEAAKQHAMSKYPEEAVGLVVAGRYVPQINTSNDPQNGFSINDAAWLAQGGVEGVIHSHPDGPDCPSALDMSGQVSSGVPWGIVVCNNADSATEPFFFGDGVPIPPLVGRSFRHGVTDCYSIIRDWYRLERKITLPDFSRNWEWWKKGDDMYRVLYTKAGFERHNEPPIVGDVFLAQVRSTIPNHGGVYLGNGLILHHLQNQLSRREPIGDKGKMITHWLRYTGK